MNQTYNQEIYEQMITNIYNTDIMFYNVNMALHTLHGKMGGNVSFSVIDRYRKILEMFDLSENVRFVLSIQECTAQEYHILKELLPNYCAILGFHCETRLSLEHYTNEDQTGLCNITVYNKTLLCLEDLKFSVGESKKHGAMFDKLMPVAVFSQRSNQDKKFVHINVHLPAPFRGKTARLESAQEIVKIVNGILNTVGEIPVIVVGDFNTVERFDGVETLEFLEQHLIRDTANKPWIGYINDDYKNPNPSQSESMDLNHIFYKNCEVIDIGIHLPLMYGYVINKDRQNIITDHHAISFKVIL